MPTLSEIEDAIRDSWGLDTAEEDDGWTPDNPWVQERLSRTRP